MKRGERHIPLRSCVVCGKKKVKWDLLRIVASAEASVEVDAVGRLPGRGAYVCRDSGCARGSLKRGRIEFALRRRLTDRDWVKVLSSTEALADEPAGHA